MRLLILAFMLVLTSASAQNINEKPTQQEMADSASRTAKPIDMKAEAAKLLVIRGWQDLTQGDTVSATRRFKQAAALNPTGADAYRGLGAAASFRGKNHIAILLFERAYSLDTHNARLAADIGVEYIRFATSESSDQIERAKHLETARQWLDKAKGIDPSLALNNANEALKLALDGDYVRMQPYIERAGSINKTRIDPKLTTLLAKEASSASNSEPEAKENASETLSSTTEISTEPQSAPSLAPTTESSSVPAATEAPIGQNPPSSQPNASQDSRPARETDAASASDSKRALVPASKPETGSTSEDKAEPAPEKEMRVISGQPSSYKGKDVRHCLNLPTNEAIARCAYSKK